jgi:phage terminase large subunit GpA-like protein
MSTTTSIAASAFAALRPLPEIRTLDWARDNVQTHEGRPYAHDYYPHIGAPGGPFDAFDCPQYQTIWLQWGSRLGKTFTGQCCLMKAAATDPGPMMFAGADQKLAIEVVKRTYAMIEKCPALRDQLRPQHRRKQDLVELDACRVYVAWARSVSTLADKAVRIGHANEIDKWEHTSTSKEADPLKLYSDRFKEFPSHKRIYESTPAVKTSSRIERGRLASTNCRYYVPCPSCEYYQTIELAGDRDYGIKWELLDGRSDKEHARKTGYFVCASCKSHINLTSRDWMMNSGVWVPEGCGVDSQKALATVDRWRRYGEPLFEGFRHADWLTGTPVRDGRDAGYILSSFYALSLSWGDIAAEFVDSYKTPQLLRNFTNQWEAKTWEIVTRKATWEEIAERLIVQEQKPQQMPKWATLVTIGADRQSDGRHPWVAVAWGPDRQAAIIGYGETTDVDSLAEIINRQWPHADGGPPCRTARVLIDSGHRPVGVYEFAMRQRQVPTFACKGSSVALAADFEAKTLGKNTALPGVVLYHVDTIRTQTWADAVLHDLSPTDKGGLSIYGGAAWEHQDLIEQLLNDAAIETLDAKGHTRESWERINTNTPNDYRDCFRYAYVAMIAETRNAQIAPRNYRPIRPVEQPASRIRSMQFRGR